MPQKERYMNGDMSPIWGIYDRLMADPSPYIILDVDPGLGKSTIVPFWYAESGYRVLCSEALVATAKGNCEYTSALYGTLVGGYIGYRAGLDRVDSRDTRVLYVSDELGFMRELNGHNAIYNILLLNDIHDWTVAQEGFEALAWKGVLDGTSPFHKVLVMSGTFNTEQLALARGNPPIYRVRGTMHNIDEQPRGESLAVDVTRLLAEGYDVLAFLPGEGEIRNLLSEVGEVRAKKLMFFSELQASKKAEVFEFADVPRLVAATNALEKGRNFVPSPGRKLAVVDSGMERVVVISKDGIERLSLQPIPLAKKEQRKRRTGRMDDGVYIDHCPIPDMERPYDPVPEIKRVRSDRTLLRYIVSGLDITTLPMLHKPSEETIQMDIDLLRRLEAVNAEGQATDLGIQMSRFRFDMRYARAILKGIELGVVGDIISLVALAHYEGIRESESDLWQDLVSEETESDLLLELELLNMCNNKSDGQLMAMGINISALNNVRDMEAKVDRIVAGMGVKIASSGRREDIITAWISGFVDDLYHHEGGRYYINGSDKRRLAFESVVVDADWIIGIPVSMQVVLADDETFSRDILKMATRVAPEQLMELAPHMVSSHLENYRYYPPKDRVICWHTTTYGDHVVYREVVYAPQGEEATVAIAQYLANANADLPYVQANNALQSEIALLSSRDPDSLKTLSRQLLCRWYLDRIGSAQSMAEIAASNLDLRMTEADVSELLQVDFSSVRTAINTRCPNAVELRGQMYTIEYGPGRRMTIALPADLISQLSDEEQPLVAGVPVGVRFTDEDLPETVYSTLKVAQSYLAGKKAVKCQADGLRSLYDQTRALADKIDWSRMEEYGLKPDEMILETLRGFATGKHFSEGRLQTVYNRLAKVLKRYGTKITD